MLFYLKDAIFIPINTESSFQGSDKFHAPSKQPNGHSKFTKTQIELPKSNKDDIGSVFNYDKVVMANPSFAPSTRVKPSKVVEPTAQVLPYDFRPGPLDIFGEVKGKNTEGSKVANNVPEEDFKYESENDLESLINVPSEYAGKITIHYPYLT